MLYGKRFIMSNVNPKRIANIVFNSFINDSRVEKISKSLSFGKNIVEVVAHYDKDLKEIERKNGYLVKRFVYFNRKTSTSKLSKLFIYLKWVAKVVGYVKDFDIIHCNDLNTLPIGFIIKRFYNRSVKIVYDAHEYEINDRPNESWVSIKIKYYIERFLIKYADRVITVSDSIAEEYARLYNIKKPVLVLNTPSYKKIEKKDLFREKLGIDKKKKIFLYQGGLSKGRGIEVILETFKLLEEEKSTLYSSSFTLLPCIVFMGYGPLEDEVKRASKEYENIYFHPAVSPDILLDFTSSADYGILFYENNCLNHYYCSPNKMFEYIMAELPVIVSNLYEMGRLVKEYQIGVVAKENTPEGLKEAIAEVIKLDKEVLNKNIKKAKEIFNWENQEKILIDAYKELG